MAFYKHCCHSIITEDHTDHCLDRTNRIATLEAEVERLRESLRTARGALKIAHRNAGNPDPHYVVLDVTRIEIERIDAALAARANGEDS